MSEIDYTDISECFDRYYLRLVAYACHYVGTQAQAEDLVQDSFIKLWQKRKDYSDYAIGSLIYTIVRNSCLDYLKKKAVRCELDLESLKLSDDFEKLYNYDFYGSYSNPTLYGELVRIVRKEVDKLPERSRQIFKMSRFEGLSNHDIAKELQISDVAVHKHIAKAVAIIAMKIDI